MVMALPRSRPTLLFKLLRSSGARTFCTTAAPPPTNGIVAGADSCDSADTTRGEIAAVTAGICQSIAHVKNNLRDLHDRHYHLAPGDIDRLCEQFYWHPFQKGGSEKSYETSVDDDGNFWIRVDVPGIQGKEVKVWIEDGNVWFNAEKKGRDEVVGDRRYAHNFPIPPGDYKFENTNALVSCGVLTIKVPKSKDGF